MSPRRSASTTAGRSGSRSSASGASSAAPGARSSGAGEGRRRRRAKRGEGDQLREEILDATHELLLETGNADKVSTRAVAERVGCSSPALYLHFPDKSALLFAVCERQFQRLGELVAAAVAGVDDPIAGLRAAGRAYVDFGLANPEEYRVMTMSPPTFVWNPAPEELAKEAGFEVLLDLLGRAMASGAIREDDPYQLALSIWSVVHGLVALRIAKPDFDWPPVEELTDRTLTVLLEGLAPRDDEPAEARRTRRHRPSTRATKRSRG